MLKAILVRLSVMIGATAALADSQQDCNQKADLDLRMRACTELIGRDSKAAGAYKNRGHVYQARGDYDRAIADYSKAIEIDPQEAGAFHRRGLAYYLKGDYDRAISDYNKAIESKQMLPFAYYGRAGAYQKRGDYNSAITEFTKVLEARAQGGPNLPFAGRHLPEEGRPRQSDRRPHHDRRAQSEGRNGLQHPRPCLRRKGAISGRRSTTTPKPSSSIPRTPASSPVAGGKRSSDRRLSAGIAARCDQQAKLRRIETARRIAMKVRMGTNARRCQRPRTIVNQRGSAAPIIASKSLKSVVNLRRRSAPPELSRCRRDGSSVQS